MLKDKIMKWVKSHHFNALAKYCFFAMGMVALLSTSCSEADRLMFDTNYASVCIPRDKDGKLCFDDTLVTVSEDTASFTFSVLPASYTEYDLQIPILVTGTPADRDRKFRLSVDAAKTTAVEGEEYVPLASEFILPADSTKITATIKLLRSEPLASASRDLALTIASTEDFPSAVIGEENRIVIRVSDILTQPVWWTTWKNAFGRYSRVKHQKWIEIWGPGALSTDRIQAPLASMYPRQALALQKLRVYFEENPTYDENGVLVSVPVYFY